MSLKRKSTTGPASKKSAPKKTSTKSAEEKRSIKRPAKKAPSTRKPARRPVKRAAKRRALKSRFSFTQLKESLSTKTAKIIVALSFISATFPSAYEWGSQHVSDAINVVEPIVATHAEGVVKQAISASPLAKTTAGVWLVDRVGRWTTPSDEGANGDGGVSPTTNKVDVVTNPFY